MDEGTSCSAPEHPRPTTVTFHPDPRLSTYFFSYLSSSSFPIHTPPPTPSLWSTHDTSEYLLNTPPFFQRILGPPHKYKTLNSTHLAERIQEGDVWACSDGSFMEELGTGTLGWVIGSSDKKIWFKSSGPVTSDPALNSSFQLNFMGYLQ
jgi:hypothetical protein